MGLKTNQKIIGLSLLLGFFMSSINAQNKDKSVVYQKKTSMDFDDAYIEGRGTTPFGSIILTTKSGMNDGVIKIRKHWRKEMVQSANLISNKK